MAEVINVEIKATADDVTQKLNEIDRQVQEHTAKWQQLIEKQQKKQSLVDKYSDEQERLSKQTQELYAKKSELVAKGADTSAIEAQIKSNEELYNTYSRSIGELTRSIEDESSALHQESAALKDLANKKQVLETGNRGERVSYTDPTPLADTRIMDKWQEMSPKLKKEFSALMSQSVYASTEEAKNAAMRGMDEILKGAQTTAAQANKSFEQMFGTESAKEFSLSIEDVKARAEKLFKQIQSAKFEYDQMYASGAPSAELDKQAAKVSNLIRQYDVLKDEIARANTETKKMNPLKMLGSTVAGGIKNTYGKYFEQIKSGISAVTRKMADTFNWSNMLKVTRNAFLDVGKAVGKLAGGALSKVAGLFKNIALWSAKTGGKMLGLVKTSGQLHKKLDRGFKTFVKYAFGVRSLYFLFRRLRTALGDGIKALSPFDSALKASIVSLKTSMSDLKGNWAAAFSPIIQAVVPMLNALIQACSRAANAVAAFFSAMSGGFSFKRAVTNSKAIEDSLGGAAAAADKATTSIDELNVVNDDSGGGGGGSALSYEDVEIPDNIKDFVEELQNLAEAGDWEGIGSLIAQKLFAAIDSIPWYELGQKIGGYFAKALAVLSQFVKDFNWQGLGADLAKFINGVLDSGIDWRQLGVVLVGRFYALWNFLAGALKDINWAELGKAVIDTLLGAIIDLDWVSTINSLVDGFNTMFKGLTEAIFSYDWASIGQELDSRVKQLLDPQKWDESRKAFKDFFIAVINAIGNVIAQFDFPTYAAELGRRFGEMMNDAFAYLQVIVDNIPWDSIGDTIGNFLNNAFGSLDIQHITFTINDFVHKIFRSLIDAISKVDWGEIGVKVAEFINGIDWNGLANDLDELVSGIIDGVFDFVINLIATIDWAELLSAIVQLATDIVTALIEHLPDLLTVLVEAIAELLINLPSLLADTLASLSEILGETFKLLGMDAIAGFFDGLSEKLRNMGEWLRTNFVDPLVNFVKDGLGIHSPSTVFKEIGIDVIGGMLSGITEKWKDLNESIKTKLGEMVEKFKEDFQTIVDDTKRKFETMHNNLTQKFENMKIQLTNKANDLKATLQTKFETIKTDLSTKFENMKTTLVSTFTNLKTEITNKADEMKRNVVEKATNIKNEMTNSFNTARSNAESAFSQMASSIQGKMGNLLSDVSSTASQIGSAVSNMVGDIGVGISNAWNSITEFARNAGSRIGEISVNVTSKLRGYAVGGIVRKPTMIGGNTLVGEDGAEAIIPLENHTEWIAMVANGLADNLLANKYIDKLATAFTNVTMPSIASGSIYPPNAISNDSAINGVANAIEGLKDVLSSSGGETEAILNALNEIAVIVDSKSMTVNIGDTDVGYANDRYNAKRGIRVNSGVFANAY